MEEESSLWLLLIIGGIALGAFVLAIMALNQIKTIKAK